MAQTHFRLLAPCILALSSIAFAQEPAPAQQTVPATPGTAQTTTTPAAPLTKKELKAQRNQQKAAEKAADESAKAQKDQANALKHQNKAINEQQKSQTAAPAPPQL